MSTYPNSYYQADRLEHILPPTAAGPIGWLRSGLRDMVAAPVTTAILGLTFTVLCVLAYIAASSLPVFSAAILVVLLMTGPFFAAAAYHVPLQRAYGDVPDTSACIDGVRNRFLSIGLFAIVCSMIVAAWTRLASIALALYYGSFASGPEIARIWTSGQQSISMLVFLAAATLILAFVLFSVSAVSLPMIAERNADVIAAIRTSMRTLRDHKLTLGLWMALIVALTGVAFLSKLFLMPLVFPLLAYATWHSYRQLVHQAG